MLTTYSAWGAVKYIYNSSAVTQFATTSVDDKATTVQILKLAVNVTSTNQDGETTNQVESVSFKMQNTTDEDVSKAMLYWTSTSDVFSTNTQFGTTVLSPTNTITFTGPSDDFGTATGDYFLWLVFDLNATGSGAGKIVDAYIPTNGLNYEDSDGSNDVTVTPSTNNPAGNRTIIGGNGSLGGGCYCATTWTDVDNAWIQKVTFTGINKESGLDNSDAFTDFSNSYVGFLHQGISYDHKVDIRSANSNANCLAWIDWNNDGDFADAGETHDLGAVSATSQVLSLAINVPVTSIADSTRMRISIKEGTDPTDCGVYGAAIYGETEDYTLHITDDGAAMNYAGVAATQNNQAGVNANTVNQEM